ncbi:MAG: hypothetical protein RR626_07960 [Anaerovoracaceae bacterium]
MAKKQTRNKARDVIGDYYKANRQVEKENEKAREESQKKGWSRSERTMLIVILVCGVAILVKYLVFK